jgi:hypothetical protein
MSLRFGRNMTMLDHHIGIGGETIAARVMARVAARVGAELNFGTARLMAIYLINNNCESDLGNKVNW